jgi:hypothetical protein
VKDIVAGIRRRLTRAQFDWRCRPVLATPPIRMRPAGLCIVSMLSTRDVLMYLVAIKSLYRQLSFGRIVVLDDGTLTVADRTLLARHLGDPQIVLLSDIATGQCPRGGCWERLLHILDLSGDSYVIQMDSDVLSLGPLPEVLDAVRDNVAFTLSSGPEFGIVDVEAAAAAVALADSRETQFAAEQSLPYLPPGLGRRYVRGSAGFAGFARGACSRAAVEAFSRAMQARLGPQWSAWGTEQVASNYAVANSPHARVLPWARYRCFYGEMPPPSTALLHFIGTWRFEGGVYMARAREVIVHLSEAAEPGVTR